MIKNAFTLVLEGHTQLTPRVRHFTFRRTDEHAFPFIPGQFITLLLETDPNEKEIRKPCVIL